MKGDHWSRSYKKHIIWTYVFFQETVICMVSGCNRCMKPVVSGTVAVAALGATLEVPACHISCSWKFFGEAPGVLELEELRLSFVGRMVADLASPQGDICVPTARICSSSGRETMGVG